MIIIITWEQLVDCEKDNKGTEKAKAIFKTQVSSLLILFKKFESSWKKICCITPYANIMLWILFLILSLSLSYSLSFSFSLIISISLQKYSCSLYIFLSFSLLTFLHTPSRSFSVFTLSIFLSLHTLYSLFITLFVYLSLFSFTTNNLIDLPLSPFNNLSPSSSLSLSLS